MQPPPPMMRGPMFMDRRRLVGLMIILGLFLLLVGAMLTDLSRTRVAGTEPPEAIAARENLGLAWGPLAGPWGMFLFVFGLLAAPGFIEHIAAFAMLLLIYLGYLVLLLILATSATVSGVPEM